jgi:hypothetical protein
MVSQVVGLRTYNDGKFLYSKYFSFFLPFSPFVKDLALNGTSSSK